MPSRRPSDHRRHSNELRLLRQLFREVERVAPGEGGGSMSGFTMHVTPEEALAALRALPDGEGMAAVLGALGHTSSGE